MRKVLFVALVAAALTAGAAPGPGRQEARYRASGERSGRANPACCVIKDLVATFGCMADPYVSQTENPACVVLLGLTQSLCGDGVVCGY